MVRKNLASVLLSLSVLGLVGGLLISTDHYSGTGAGVVQVSDSEANGVFGGQQTCYRYKYSDYYVVFHCGGPSKGDSLCTKTPLVMWVPFLGTLGTVDNVDCVECMTFCGSKDVIYPNPNCGG